MRLNDKQVAKYQQLYLDTFGVSLSKVDALNQGLALMRFVRALCAQGSRLPRNVNEYSNVNKKEICE